MDALVRHGEYSEEWNEVYKWERIHGQELTVEGVHEILVYEIGWREDRDWAQHEDAAEVRRMHGVRESHCHFLDGLIQAKPPLKPFC